MLIICFKSLAPSLGFKDGGDNKVTTGAWEKGIRDLQTIPILKHCSFYLQ